LTVEKQRGSKNLDLGVLHETARIERYNRVRSGMGVDRQVRLSENWEIPPSEE
jgi:hypothetical protein